MAAIYLDRLLPAGSPDESRSDLPAGGATLLPPTLGPSYRLLGLAGGGVYPAGIVANAAVRSYRTISPLPVNRRIGTIGCVFSAALSRGLPRVAVSHHRALSCPDFPPTTKVISDRPTHSFQFSIRCFIVFSLRL